MDMIRFGAFLKELRKEKGLTQEQLAEQLHTSGRTVSRWETGSNLPDIDTLLLLADFYQVDVRELMEGKRTPQQEQAPENTVKQLAEYASRTEQQLLRKIFSVLLCGLAAWGSSLVLILHFVQDAFGGSILLLLSIGCLILYGLCVFAVRANRTAAGYLHTWMGAFIASTLSHLVIFLFYFGTGSYRHFGLLGIAFALFVFITFFSAAGFLVTGINQKALPQAVPTKQERRFRPVQTCTFWFVLASIAVVLLNLSDLDDMNLLMIGINPILNFLSSSPWCTAIANTPGAWHVLSIVTMIFYGLLLDGIRYIKKKLTTR